MWSVKELVTALAAALFIAVSLAALTSRGDEREETLPTRTTSSTSIGNSNASPTPVSSTSGNAVDRFANAVMGSQNSNSNVNTRRRR